MTAYLAMLRFTDDGRARAPAHAAEHGAWIARGLTDGVFLLVGTLGAGEGGAILAHGGTLAELERRLAEDPFVAHGVVRVEVHAIAPARADPRLAFLLA